MMFCDVIYVDFVKKAVIGKQRVFQDPDYYLDALKYCEAAKKERTVRSTIDENNVRVFEKIMKGDNLSLCTPEDTWFPNQGIFSRALGRMIPSRDADK